MQSSNLLKSKISVLRVGGSWNFDAEFKFAKIQIPMLRVGEGSRGILMLSSNLLKSKIPMLRGGGGVRLWNFNAEFKFAKIQNSRVEGGGLVEF